MRSRFSAFCVEDEAYLLRTWHPSTRPPRIDFDAALRWRHLEILRTSGGTGLDTGGTVHFRAHYVRRNRAGRAGHADYLEEHSRFVTEAGIWLYVGPLASLPGTPPAQR